MSMQRFYSENLNRRDHRGDHFVNGKTILNWILKKYDIKVCDIFVRHRIRDRLLTTR